MGTKKIIIVDDDESVLELFSAVLEKQGYKVKTFMRGWEALQFVSRELPDLVILDIMMPRVNGFEVCQILKENFKTSHIPVMFLSALSHQDAMRRAAEGGADDFLVKPCATDKLVERVAIQLKKVREGAKKE